MLKVTKDYLTFIVDPAVRRFCGPLFFTRSLETPVGHIHANGSFGLVNTGKKHLLVTCNHVWEEFKEIRREKPDLQLGLSLDMGKPVSVKPDDYFIDADKGSDLATFDMQELIDAGFMGNLEFYDMHAKRPPKVNVEDVLYFIGFPGKGRVEEDKAVGFPRQAFGVQATQVGESKFFSDCSNLKLDSKEVGGISGCPCFVIRDPQPMRMVGFAIGFSDEGKRMQFTYVKYIQPDGIVRYVS